MFRISFINGLPTFRNKNHRQDQDFSPKKINVSIFQLHGVTFHKAVTMIFICCVLQEPDLSQEGQNTEGCWRTGCREQYVGPTGRKKQENEDIA
jgi:hypothetical protein